MDHPELRTLLSDFMQKLLLAKPRNVLEFAKQFFEPFLHARPESEEPDYSSSSSSSSSQSSSCVDEGEGAFDFRTRRKNKKSKSSRQKIYPILNPTDRPYDIEDYFTEDENGFILPPRLLSGESEEEEGEETEFTNNQSLIVPEFEVPTYIFPEFEMPGEGEE